MKCEVVFTTKSGVEEKRDFTYAIEELNADADDYKKQIEIRISRKFEALIKRHDWINADKNVRVKSEEIDTYEIVIAE